MHLTGLDLLFWAAGFIENLGLLFVLWYRRRARAFPFFSTLIALIVCKTMALYLVSRFGTKRDYTYAYWSLAMADTALQLCVVYEVASRVFRPLNVWAEDIRKSFVWLVSLSLLVACGLTWLANVPSDTWAKALTNKGNLFGSALLSELFVVMMALSIKVRLPWRTHVAKIAQGLGAYSLIGVLIDTGRSYFGISQERSALAAISHVRMVVDLGCVGYWIVSLWPDELPARTMTAEMRQKLFALQAQVEYHLDHLRSRKK